MDGLDNDNSMEGEDVESANEIMPEATKALNRFSF